MENEKNHVSARIAGEGIDPKTKITLRVKGLPAKNVLNLMLSLKDLTWRIEGDRVEIVRKKED